MSLNKKLSLFTYGVLVLLFVGMSAIYTFTVYTHAKRQAVASSQEVAFTLARALAPYVMRNDTLTVQRLVDSVLVYGSFTQVTVRGEEGQVITKREGRFLESNVPTWFLSHIPLRFSGASIKQSLINGGQFSIDIQPHPGRTYNILWESTLGSLGLLLMLMIVGKFFVGGVSRAVIKPVNDIERQARGVTAREFIEIKDVPRVQELHSAVDAMNVMVRSVDTLVSEQSSIADKLRDEAYTDAVTGLGNRRAFELRLEAIMRDEEASPHGALLLLRVDELKSYNELHGIEAGDELLSEVAKIACNAFRNREKVLTARVGGADIAILVPGADFNEVKVESEKLSSRLAQIPYRGEKRVVSHIGISVYLDKNTMSSLLANADSAVRAAQDKGPYTWAWSSIDDGEIKNWSYTSEQWRKLIDRVIEQRNVVLVYQPVLATTDDSVLHYEIFVRLEDEAGEYIPAGVFMPVVERLGLAPAIDRVVIENVMKRWQEDGNFDIRYAVNLSPASLVDSTFLEWLYGVLLINPDLGKGLIIEISEYGLQANVDAVKSLVQRLKVLGVGTSLDHFGIGFATVGYIRSLAVDYVKLDGSYVRDIKNNSDNKNIVKVLTEVSRGINVHIVAESIESESDWNTVKSLGLDGGRGFWLGRPQLLNECLSPAAPQTRGHLQVVK